MTDIFQKFRDSYGELKRTSSLVGLSLLVAMSIVLSFFLRLDFGPQLRVGVAFLCTALMGMIYGPLATGLAAGAGDLVKYLLRPTGPYFFGFTLNTMLAGVFYGVILYRGKRSLPRVILAKSAVNILLNGLLNTYWLSTLYGDAYGVLLLPRLGKNLFMLVVEIPLLYLTLNAVGKVLERMKKL